MSERRFGANIWSVPRELRVPSQFMRKVRDLGYEGVELAVDDTDLSLNRSELSAKWRAIREDAESLGIKLPSVASGLYWRRNFVTDPDAALEVVEAECIAANEVGAKVVLVVPGVAVPSIPYREHFGRVASALRRAASIAREYGVTIGLEPVWNRLFPTPLEFKRLLDEVGEDNVALYFDVGNTLPHTLPEHWIRELGGRIVQIHVKDFSIEALRFGPPGTGSVNWGEVRKALDEIGYSGWVVAEVPWGKEDPYAPLAETIVKVKELLG